MVPAKNNTWYLTRLKESAWLKKQFIKKLEPQTNNNNNNNITKNKNKNSLKSFKIFKRRKKNFKHKLGVRTDEPDLGCGWSIQRERCIRKALYLMRLNEAAWKNEKFPKLMYGSRSMSWTKVIKEYKGSIDLYCGHMTQVFTNSTLSTWKHAYLSYAFLQPVAYS